MGRLCQLLVHPILGWGTEYGMNLRTEIHWAPPGSQRLLYLLITLLLVLVRSYPLMILPGGKRISWDKPNPTYLSKYLEPCRAEGDTTFHFQHVSEA